MERLQDEGPKIQTTAEPAAYTVASLISSSKIFKITWASYISLQCMRLYMFASTPILYANTLVYLLNIK